MTHHPPPGLRLGSLCTGYGGLDMAVRAVFGGSLAWVADNDPGAARILAHYHPRVPNLGDIAAVDWTAVPPVDVVLGGYPCQPFSSAGKRKGTADARHIWPHIACALRVLRPRYAVFENVAGHLSLGFDTVLADLAALGFDARWCTLRASDVGAAHQRNRLFVLAWPAHPQGEGRQRPGVPGRPADDSHTAADALDVGGDRYRARGAGRDEPAARGLAAADPGGRGLQGSPSGNRSEPAQPFPDADGPGLVRRAPAHAQGLGEREPADQAHPLPGSRDARPVPGRGGLLTAPDPASDGRDQGRAEPARQQGGSDTAVGGAPDWGEYAPAIHRWEHVLGRPAPRPTDTVGRLNPSLVEWLMGLPEGHVTAVPGLSRTAQLRALGNGVVPQQAEVALRSLANRPAARHTASAA
jgi:DNA (cytosine-5)-methyltransferase 1